MAENTATPKERRKDRRKNIHKNRRRKQKGCFFIFLLIALALIIFAVSKLLAGQLTPPFEVDDLKDAVLPSWVDVQLIDVDGISREGVQLEGVKDIVIHYTGNPGTTAQQNRNYYNNPDSEVSSHFVIGLDGEVILCVPLYEKSSASNRRNIDTISIEVCHPDETGKFTEASYNSLVRLTARLSELCRLDKTHIIRHYDVTEKECPLYFVQHEDQWEQFKTDVSEYEE